MNKRGRYRIPPMCSLIAFETAARCGSFSVAARELGTSQSAVSRHIATLERQLCARLFERSPTGVRLTRAGHSFHRAVLVGLGALRGGAFELSGSQGRVGTPTVS